MYECDFADKYYVLLIGDKTSLFFYKKNIEIKDGKCSIIFASPEAVLQDFSWTVWLNLSSNIAFLAINETHCVVEWYKFHKTIIPYKNGIKLLFMIKAL